jgi:hypothetical protein
MSLVPFCAHSSDQGTQQQNFLAQKSLYHFLHDIVSNAMPCYNFSNRHFSVLCNEHINFLLTAFCDGSTWSIAVMQIGNVPVANVQNCWLGTIFHTHCVGMFMSYLDSKFYVPNAHGSTRHLCVITYLFNIAV